MKVGRYCDMFEYDKRNLRTMIGQKITSFEIKVDVGPVTKFLCQKIFFGLSRPLTYEFLLVDENDILESNNHCFSLIWVKGTFPGKKVTAKAIYYSKYKEKTLHGVKKKEKHWVKAIQCLMKNKLIFSPLKEFVN